MPSSDRGLSATLLGVPIVRARLAHKSVELGVALQLRAEDYRLGPLPVRDIPGDIGPPLEAERGVQAVYFGIGPRRWN